MISQGRATPKRTCDRCGALRPGNAFRVRAGRWICNWHDHYVAPEELEKIPIQTFPIKPFKDAKPFDPRDTYERAEWEIFNYVTEWYTTDFDTISNFTIVRGGTSAANTHGVHGAGWACIYLYELIAENKRPARMVALARTKLQEIADWLLTRQWGAPHVGSAATWDPFMGWGGYAVSGVQLNTTSASFLTLHTIVAGIGMLRAYQILGDSRYLESARASAWFIRSAQSMGKRATGYASNDASGNSRLDIPTPPSELSYSGGSIGTTSRYTPAGALALEFFQVYEAVVGNETIGSSAITAEYSLSRATTVAEAKAALLNTWKVGIFDHSLGTVVTGLSATTPYARFVPFPFSGAWEHIPTSDSESCVTGTDFAHGLRGIYAVEGASSFVTSVFDWLMSFSSNTTNQFAAETALRMESGTSDKAKQAGIRGTYAPTTGIASFLSVKNSSGATVKYESIGAFYMLSTVGVLAELWATRQPAAFKELKNKLNEPQQWTKRGDQDGRVFFLGPMGACGLNYQPRRSSTSGFNLVCDAAQLGLIYREQPKAFMGVGH